MQPVDAHVHIAGNGTGGTGCWIQMGGWHRCFAAMMLAHVGLPMDALRRDFDRLYLDRLLELVRSSSLGAVVILAHDQVYDERGCRMEGIGSHYTPNEYVLRLAREHPEFRPGVSIHPARPDAMEELERCLAGGAALLKILPNCHNVDCGDRRFQRFWERMAEAGLPLLAHTGGEVTVPVVRPEWANPRVLEFPLQCGVTVIAAHCAIKSTPFDRDYYPIFVEMTHRYPKLYGDTSAFTVPIRGRHIRECMQSPIVERLVHGSDFPVPVYGHWSFLRGLVDWKNFRKWERQTNPLERDYQLKRAMGFPEEVFTRIGGLLRPSAAC
jgi:hypothetical protein